jgi:hypothetical protein
VLGAERSAATASSALREASGCVGSQHPQRSTARLTQHERGLPAEPCEVQADADAPSAASKVPAIAARTIPRLLRNWRGTAIIRTPGESKPCRVKSPSGNRVPYLRTLSRSRRDGKGSSRRFRNWRDTRIEKKSVSRSSTLQSHCGEAGRGRGSKIRRPGTRLQDELRAIPPRNRGLLRVTPSNS